MENMKGPLTATMEELTQFLFDVERYQKDYPRERSKMTLLMIKQTQRYSKIQKKAAEEYQSDVAGIRIKYASVDKDDNIIEQKYDVKQGKGDDNTILRMAYKKEAQAKMNKEIEELTKNFTSKEIEIKPPYSSGPFFAEIPENFDFNYLESFKKFIFDPEISEEEVERIYLAQKPEKQKLTIKSVLDN